MNEKIESALALLREAKASHGDKVAYSCSFGMEGSVLIDLIARYKLDIPIMTLDTGRLPQATYDAIAAIEAHHGIRIRILFPDCREVEAMVNEHGVNLFYQSVELRKRCCEVRKVYPLQNALKGLDAWVTGRRREQSEHRQEMRSVENDPVFGLKKYNPLIDWSEADVWNYIRANHVPYNRLHDAHYVSIGCECCTRAIAVGEDPRAGRWWWESGESLAECGLHVTSIATITGEGEQGEGI